jgi:hypothetical protein
MPFSTILWLSSGYTGAPGYTRFKFSGNLDSAGANAAAAASRALISSIAAYTPSVMTYTCQSGCQGFEDDGTLTGEVPVTSLPAAVNGSSAGGYTGGAGAVVYWLTAAFNGGHKIRGRTYFVPLGGGAYQADGTLQSTVVTALQTAATTFVGTTPKPVVWSQKLDQADRVDKVVDVLSAQVKDRSAFLRTRRT